ncbi:MAG: response regulator [Methylococcales bacterium]|nr:response regulator [Methylococcales bacterium]
MSSIQIKDLSILLIEPSAMQLKVIVKHLQDEGIERVEAVTSGNAAFESLQQFHPDLIISSLYLPDMTAVDLVHQLRETEIWQHIPFMLISSETKFHALDPIRQAGVMAILPKPFTHQDLKRALRTTVEFIDPDEVALQHFDVEALRVLVVDDSQMARKHIARVLNNMGIERITFAINGREAVDIFIKEQQAFDLIVTDYNMPEMDGEELIRYIRIEMANTFIPILMVTSEENETRLSNVQQSGVSAICDKPFDPQTVKDMLFRILDE